MRNLWTLPFLSALVWALPAAAQVPGAATMPSGSYLIQARDTAKAADVGIIGWPFVLKGNGGFTITTPDSLTFTGKLTQKDGVATYTDQSCETPGVYLVRQERGGYAFDFQSGGCAENAGSLGKLLFVLGKPKK